MKKLELAKLNAGKCMSKYLGIKTGDVVKLKGGGMVRVVSGFNVGDPDMPYVDIILEDPRYPTDDATWIHTRYIDVNDFIRLFEILEI